LKLIPYRQCLHGLCQRIEFKHIRRIHNEVADALATLASMLHHPNKAYVDPSHIQVREQHAYCNMVEEEPTSEQKRTIRRLASGFFFSGGVLYKRTPDLGLLRCIDARQAASFMSEVHLGVCHI